MNLKVFKFNRAANLLLVTIFIYGIVYSAWGLFLNLFVLASNFNKEFLGLANMMPAVAALVLGIPLGMLADRLGQKKAMLIGLAVASLACGLMAVGNSAALIMTASFLWGLGTTLFTICNAPMLMGVSDESNRLTLFSLNGSLQILSGVFGNYTAGLIPGITAGWFKISEVSPSAYQAVFACAGLVGLLGLIPVYFIHKEKHKFIPKEIKPADAIVNSPSDVGLKWLFSKDVIRLLLPNLITGAGAGILIPYFNVFYMEKFGLRNEDLGFLFSLSALITGAAMLVGPRLARLCGSKIKAVVLTQALSLIFMMLLGFSSNLTVSSIGFLARAMLMNIAPPVWMAFVMEQTVPGRQATISSYLNLLWTAGWLSGPYISGLVQERYGFSPLFVATFVLYGLAIFLTWKFFHKTETCVETSGEPNAEPVNEAYLQVAVEEVE
jgi:MFS family permease